MELAPTRVLAFAFRVSVASFLNAVSDRVPQGQGWAGET